jgi:superfamily II DNA/RNA helicase
LGFDRLLDHLHSAEDSFKSTFRNCKYLVYDEADKLRDGQFDEHLDAIAAVLPKKKQVMFFSATMGSTEETIEDIRKLSQGTDEVRPNTEKH